MTTLEQQLKASVDIASLRKMDVKYIVALRKACDAELLDRKALVRRMAAELSSAGIIIAPRAKRRDTGKKRPPRATVRLLRVDENASLDALDNELDAPDEARRVAGLRELEAEAREAELFDMEQAGRNEP